MATAPARERILTVSELNRRIKGALEESFPGLWVRGEITDWKKSSTGHFYFCLKDRFAQIEVVLYSKERMRLRFDPTNGMAVDAYGRVSAYEPRGKCQLVVETMRPAGMGDRLLALEELKKKLQAEGLFDAARKRPLPRFPRRVGLVTSPVGAAIRDLVKVLRARWPAIEIVLAPVRVQGPGAAQE
ncbi:MAG: exodeoxyribonuclease VII large subunit [Candidatus Eisenbacteria bacterium]|uniref:Exodeoxyribonuclease VII large subunit n=1 Tax=Eiseniibacteriota bacterium TaxID=2212470 RepID=A0A538TYW2_UNCEI|nr:MAG: exodeoxyribonuclease VII large subunit [Candidatus Eisenbacteria bacterium]